MKFIFHGNLLKICRSTQKFYQTARLASGRVTVTKGRSHYPLGVRFHKEFESYLGEITDRCKASA